MIQRTKALSAILVTASLLFAGCLGQEESPFYGEEIEPIVPVEDFVLFDETLFLRQNQIPTSWAYIDPKRQARSCLSKIHPPLLRCKRPFSLPTSCE